MLAKLDKLTPSKAAFLIAVIGVLVYVWGLGNPFIGDDLSQIVNNPPVHSLSNIIHFFEGGTFYYGQGSTLSGGYYRPLMTTVYSALYTMFGPQSLPFHLLQLLVCIAGTIILYRVFAHFFRPAIALGLALVFLIHPANSQVVFAIPALQDALFFFFGILAVWLLIRFQSIGSLWAVAACLLLSLLSKESGVLFIGIALVYLIGYDRRRLFPFIGILVLPVSLYLVLKIHAVGLDHNPQNAPIDGLDLAGRLLTAPSIIWFYFTRFLFPLPLASAYYWVNPTFTIGGFLLPLIADLAVITALVYVAFAIRQRGSRAQLKTYAFFSLWSAFGLVAHMQIIPLDMTASETWLYFPVAGFLGMIGTALTAVAPSFKFRFNPRMIGAVALIVVIPLGIRTAIRGTAWRDAYALAVSDISTSPEDFNAETTIAYHLFDQGDVADAKAHALHATAIFSTLATENTLGQILLATGDYAGAHSAFDAALSHQEIYYVYENLGVLTVYSNNLPSNISFLGDALKKFPSDGPLWFYLAISEQRAGNNQAAKVAITNAAQLGAGTPYYYDNIMANKPLVLPATPPQLAPQQ